MPHRNVQQPQHNVNSSVNRTHSAPPQGTRPPQRTNAARARAQAKRRKALRKKRIMHRVLAVVLIIALCVAGVGIWINSTANAILAPGIQGTLDPLLATNPTYSGDVVNLLLLGLDWEEGRVGMRSDVIVYIHLDRVNKTMNMLQIPRDTFVGTHLKTGGTGKINTLYQYGEDSENPVNNVAAQIYEMYKLPVDYFVTIDMEALTEVVDRFGGVEVYVSQDLDYKGSTIKSGTWTLTGAEVDFFLRYRYGEGFERADFDRLENQRHFYSSIFKRIRTMTPSEMAKLMPVFTYYCSTSMDAYTAAALGIDLITMDSSNILMATMPSIDSITNYGVTETFAGHDIVNSDKQAVADLLNEYFRAEGEFVDVSELNIQQWDPNPNAVYPAAITKISEVEASEQSDVTE